MRQAQCITRKMISTTYRSFGDMRKPTKRRCEWTLARSWRDSVSRHTRSI